jgi:glyoxylase-like metal-dependent hydrolase (beta-lactamase superfamily II)
MFALPGAPAGKEGSSTVLSGDVLFAGSIGRTDLPGGDAEAMARSLTGKVLPLPDDTVVLPGHGPSTTIGRERRSNPFLLELAQRA